MLHTAKTYTTLQFCNSKSAQLCCSSNTDRKYAVCLVGVVHTYETWAYGMGSDVSVCAYQLECVHCTRLVPNNYTHSHTVLQLQSIDCPDQEIDQHLKLNTALYFIFTRESTNNRASTTIMMRRPPSTHRLSDWVDWLPATATTTTIRGYLVAKAMCFSPNYCHTCIWYTYRITLAAAAVCEKNGIRYNQRRCSPLEISEFCTQTCFITSFAKYSISNHCRQL